MLHMKVEALAVVLGVTVTWCSNNKVLINSLRQAAMSRIQSALSQTTQVTNLVEVPSGTRPAVVMLNSNFLQISDVNGLDM